MGESELQGTPSARHPLGQAVIAGAARIAALFAIAFLARAAEPIDRHALVTRHNVTLTNASERLTLQVGNGEFAFGVDVTGLQTLYGNTMSQWGWHSFPLPDGKRAGDFKLTDWDTYGRNVGYATSSRGEDELYKWLRENPHRINLGRLRLRLDGKVFALQDVRKIHQELDLWRGVITSGYELAGESVRVETCAHPTLDAIAVRIESPFVAAGRLSVEIAFPYGSPQITGADWMKPQSHQTTMAMRGGNRADFTRQLDADRYSASLAWSGKCSLKQESDHAFTLSPGGPGSTMEFLCAFASQPLANELPIIGKVFEESSNHWKNFWSTGGAVDLSGSKDARWFELERRIVLSQYVLAVNEAGSLPPQESGLFNNGWNGKFHLEMHWWHGVHYALWNRWPMFEKSLGWYQRILPSAREKALQQGYRGARWPKMVGPEGRDSPSGVGPLLIWQQPHPIYYAELDHRLHPTRETFEKWRDVVFATADFMASFAVWDSNANCHVLGPPIKTVPENTDAKSARNPPFELSYWQFGLRIAQKWREQLGLPREPEWDKVLKSLAKFPQLDGVYLPQEGMTNAFTKWNWEHPSLVGPLGMLPGDGADPAIMRATVRKVWETWQWDRKTWGWDFPMIAMAAARNGESKIAVDALLHPAARNKINEAGLSEGGPYPYFPSNGGLLSAVAMMAAGWDGAPKENAPGFPSDGSWLVRWENLRPMP